MIPNSQVCCDQITGNINKSLGYSTWIADESFCDFDFIWVFKFLNKIIIERNVTYLPTLQQIPLTLRFMCNQYTIISYLANTNVYFILAEQVKENYY